MIFGAVRKLGGDRNFKISPAFAMMMPSSGQIEKLGTLGLQGQIGQGEREGADSGKPEVEARLALQFQLDQATAVAPAQLIWSGFYGTRTSITSNTNYTGGVQPSCTADAADCAAYQAAYPNGFAVSSHMYGNQLIAQLPTRWATLVVSGYRGGDLRFFFGGQLNTFYTDTGGLYNPVTFASLDGGPLGAAGPSTLACSVPFTSPLTACPTSSVVIAPERPVRSFGGFVNLGLPLSRWFNANPKGHNGGWQLYLHTGKDQVVHRDLTNPNDFGGALPVVMGKMVAATLYYRVNPWCTFAFEQSIYASRLAGIDYSIAGSPSNEWQDHRTEFGPVFTF